jgi:predicted nucleic acid-binding protein
VKLLDTAVAIDHLRGYQPAVDLLRRLIDEDDTILSSEAVRFELLAGVRDEERDALEELCSVLAWIPVDESVSRTAGLMARTYRASHSGIDDVDYLIAASAIVADAELLTTNIRHYPMLPGLESPY